MGDAAEREHRGRDEKHKATPKAQPGLEEKADETGSLYGSVGAGRIAELLSAAGHATDEKDVRLDEPIKSVGTHEVPIHIFGEHYAGIRVMVEAE